MGSIEEWRPVVGYAGAYEVSSLGNVRSLDRVVAKRTGVRMPIKGRVLRPGRNACGRMCASLSRKSHLVSRLVANAFLGNTTDMCVDHIDGNPLNNTVSNLRICTKGQNNAHLTKIRANNKSGVTGVHWSKQKKAWVAWVRCKGTNHYFGKYASKDDAIVARTVGAAFIHGEYAAGWGCND